MTRVVIAGRWDGGDPALPTGEALGAIRRGVLAGASDPVVVTVPFGTGPTFDEAVAALGSQASFVRVPTDAPSSREAGERVADSLRDGGTVIVEGGHSSSPDCGVGFLEGLLGVAGIDPRQPESLADALTRAQSLVSDTGVDPARQRGSGAGGGVGAVIAAIGGRIAATGDLLSSLLGLEAIIDGADLVIVAEPELASPMLAESTLDCVTRVAAAHALPVVAITHRSSLSHFEKAEWGLHGVFETEGSVTLDDAGRRVARTWLR